ncbi:MAG: SH3 domain-containing protein [Anaerolineales bacterium]|nr:SH3 domain-containing protein [Anaerolineales bacterium]
MKDNWRDQQTRQTRRPRRLEEVSSAEIGFPVVWVLVGALAGLLVIGLIGLGVVNILRKQAITPTPEVIPGLAPTQPIVEATTTTAPSAPNVTPTLPPVVTLEPTATPIPTATPVPTVPTELAKGGYAQVIGTEGFGVSLRAGPGTNNARLDVAPEESVVLILDGPRADENQEDIVWWFVRGPNGTEGWAAQNFLKPTLPPGTAQSTPGAEETTPETGQNNN